MQRASFSFQNIITETYTEDCLTTFFNVANETYSVEIRQNKDNPGLYRMIHPYAAYGAATDKEYYIEIDATDPEGVYIPGIYGTGFEAGYGEVSITSMAYYYMANQGVSLEDVKGGSHPGRAPRRVPPPRRRRPAWRPSTARWASRRSWPRPGRRRS